MKKRAIILHPAIAPYRVDFFNSLAKEFDASFYFEFDNALEQAFDQEKLRKRLCFAPHFLSSGFMGIKNLRLEVLTILWMNKADVVFVSEYNLLGLFVCFYKLLFNWNLTVVSICDDNVSMAQGTHFVKKLTRYVMLHILSIVVLADNNVLTWYESNLRFKSKYVYFPIIQSDNFFRERLLKALSISVSIADRYSLIGKKNILYIIFFMSLIACKQEAIFELEGHSGQALRNGTVGLRYPTAPGRQYFLSTQADSSDCFFLTGEITPGKVAFLNFGYQRLPLYVEKQHYRVVKESDNYYILSDQKESLQNRYVQYMCQIYTLDSAYNRLCQGYDTISDINRKALLSDRLKLDFARRNDRIIQGIKEFAGTEIALNIVNELMYI